MIKGNHLTIEHIQSGRRLIDDLSFIVNDGEKAAVIGEEGNGKSLLLKTLFGRLPEGFSYSGVIEINGRIGYLEQNPKEIWGDANVLDFFLLDDPSGTVDPHEYNRLETLVSYLAKVSFPPHSWDEKKTIGEFSGGEVVKLCLAKLLFLNPDVYLLDEPSNDLDLQSLLYLESFLQELKTPVMFVSHDEKLLGNVATGIIHLSLLEKRQKAATVFERLPYGEYKTRRLQTMDSNRMIALKQRSDYQKKMDHFNQIFQKVAYRQDQAVRNPTEGRLLKKKMHALKSMERRYEKEKTEFVPIPEEDVFLKLFFGYDTSIPSNKKIIDFHGPLQRNGDVLIEKIDLEVYGPRKLAVIGDNGIGKSTLMSVLYQLLLNREDIRVGYIPQNFVDLLPLEETPIAFLAHTGDVPEANENRRILGFMRFVYEEMERPIVHLSGGAKTKLMFLKLIVDRCNVLILDEPTRNLSPLSAPGIYDLLNSFQGAIVCVTHDRTFIENVFDDIFLLSRAGLHAQ